jgi:hypothetical protein
LFSPNTVHFAFHPYSKQIRGNSPSLPIYFAHHVLLLSNGLMGIKEKTPPPSKITLHAEKQGKGKAKAKDQHKFPQ